MRRNLIALLTTYWPVDKWTSESGLLQSRWFFLMPPFGGREVNT
jgi:hypothetical protein